jgi:hypothetical protein
MKRSQLIHRLWRLLFAKRSAGTERQPRRAGLEPLEPRTVLSASGMAGIGRPDHSYESQDDDHRGRYVEREMAPRFDFSHRGERNEKYFDDAAFATRYDAPARVIDLNPSRSEDRLVVGSLTPPSLPGYSAPVGQTAVESHEAPTLAVLTPYVQAATRFESELFVAPSRSTNIVTVAPVVVTFGPGAAATGATIVIAPANPISSITIISLVSANSFERRYENVLPAVVSYVREAPSSAPVRAPAGAALNGIDTGAARAADPEMWQRLAASLTLVSSSVVSDGWSGHFAVASDADDRGEQPLANQRPSPQSEASENDSSLDLDATNPARERRKLAAALAADGAALSPEAQRLADLPAIRDALFLLHGLWQATDEAIVALVAAEQPGNATLADDGMVELLAVDVASGRQSSARPVEPVAVTAHAVALQAEIGLYQAFEVENSSVAGAPASGGANPSAASQVAQVVTEQPPAE